MELRVISTGSKGNCYALREGTDVLLLDAGVPLRKILAALPMEQKIIGAVVTHEHQDHAKGVEGLLSLSIPVYASKGTADALINPDTVDNLPGIMQAIKGRQFTLGPFTVSPFDTPHDAAEPLGFLIRNNHTGELLLYATDTPYLRYTFPGVHYWLIECNYCKSLLDAMTEGAGVDLAFRRRLLHAHMSMEQLCQTLRANDLRTARKIILCHLSDQRSDEKQMVEKIHEQTDVDTVAAEDGMMIDLELYPF